MTGYNLTNRTEHVRSGDDLAFIVGMLAVVLPAILFNCVVLVKVLCHHQWVIQMRLILAKILSLQLLVAFNLLSGLLMAANKYRYEWIPGKAFTLPIKFCPSVLWIISSGEAATGLIIATFVLFTLLYMRSKELIVSVSRVQLVIALLSITAVGFILCSPTIAEKKAEVHLYCFPNLHRPKNGNSNPKLIAFTALFSTVLTVPLVVMVISTLVLLVVLVKSSRRKQAEENKESCALQDQLNERNGYIKMSLFLLSVFFYKVITNAMLMTAAATYNELPKVPMAYGVLTLFSFGIWVTPCVITMADRHLRRQVLCC